MSATAALTPIEFFRIARDAGFIREILRWLPSWGSAFLVHILAFPRKPLGLPAIYTKVGHTIFVNPDYVFSRAGLKDAKDWNWGLPKGQDCTLSMSFYELSLAAGWKPHIDPVYHQLQERITYTEMTTILHSVDLFAAREIFSAVRPEFPWESRFPVAYYLEVAMDLFRGVDRGAPHNVLDKFLDMANWNSRASMISNLLAWICLLASSGRIIALDSVRERHIWRIFEAIPAKYIGLLETYRLDDGRLPINPAEAAHYLNDAQLEAVISRKLFEGDLDISTTLGDTGRYRDYKKLVEAARDSGLPVIISYEYDEYVPTSPDDPPQRIVFSYRGNLHVRSRSSNDPSTYMKILGPLLDLGAGSRGVFRTYSSSVCLPALVISLVPVRFVKELYQAVLEKFPAVPASSYWTTPERYIYFTREDSAGDYPVRTPATSGKTTPVARRNPKKYLGEVSADTWYGLAKDCQAWKNYHCFVWLLEELGKNPDLAKPAQRKNILSWAAQWKLDKFIQACEEHGLMAMPTRKITGSAKKK